MVDELEGTRPAAKRTVKGSRVEGTDRLSKTTSNDVIDARAEAAAHKRDLARSKQEHDQKLEQDDAMLRRRKEWSILMAVFALGAFLCLACGIILVLPGTPMELRDKTVTGLFGLMTAALGFLAGKGSQKL